MQLGAVLGREGARRPVDLPEGGVPVLLKARSRQRVQPVLVALVQELYIWRVGG